MTKASRLVPTLAITALASLLLACGGGGSSSPSSGGPSTGGPSTGGPSTGGPSTGGSSTDAGGATQDGGGEAATPGTSEREPITPEELQRTANNREISATANLCFNPAWYENATEAHLIYSYEDDPQGQRGTIHFDYQVGFFDAARVRQTQTLSVHVPGQPARQIQETRSYGTLRTLLASGNELRPIYDETGIETDTLGESLEQYTVATYEQVKVHGEFFLLPGELFESKGAHVTNIKLVGTESGEVHHLPTVNGQYAHKVLYKGRERITVPAGTFDTCRMAYIGSEGNKEFITDYWYAVNSGAVVQQLLSYSWLSPNDENAPVALQLRPGSTLNDTPVDPEFPPLN